MEQFVDRISPAIYMGVLREGGDSDAKSAFFQFSPFSSKISFRRGGGGMLYLFGISKRRPFQKGMGWGGGVKEAIFLSTEAESFGISGSAGFFLLFLCVCLDCVCCCMCYVPISLLSPTGPCFLLFFVMTKSKSMSPSPAASFPMHP